MDRQNSEKSSPLRKNQKKGESALSSGEGRLRSGRLVTVLKVEEIILEELLCLGTSGGGFFLILKAAQILCTSLEGDLSAPLAVALIPIDTTDTAGVVLEEGGRLNHFNASTVSEMSAGGSGNTATTASGMTAGQIVLTDFYFLATLADALPEIVAVALADQLNHGEVSELLAYKVLCAVAVQASATLCMTGL